LQLAIQYAHYVREASPQTRVFWVHASNTARLEQGYRDIAEQVKLPGWNDTQADVFKLVHSWLRNEKNGKWLLILINADDSAALLRSSGSNHKTQTGDGNNTPPHHLSVYLPHSKNGSILVTSQTKSVALQLVEESDIILIEPMNDPSAQVLVSKASSNNGKKGVKVLKPVNMWSPAEDEKLLYIVQTMKSTKPNWNLVAQSFRDRSDYACQRRYEKLMG
jgi:hypothetical protein